MTRVTCALIEKDGRYLVTQRSESMKMPLKWEFPGGKIKAGESPETCMTRELKEELDINVEIITGIEPIRHTYPGFKIELLPFYCKILSGEIKLSEHSAFRWVSINGLGQLDLTAADQKILKYLD